MKTDTKVIVAGGLLLVLGAWYVQRQVKNAASSAVDGLTGAVAGAWGAVTGAVVGGGNAVVEAFGTQGYTDPATGVYTPYGAVPPPPAGTSYNVPWYLGGGTSSEFDAQGNYIGGGTYGSAQVQQATQADVRRVDNAIAAGGGASWWPYVDFSKL